MKSLASNRTTRWPNLPDDLNGNAAPARDAQAGWLLRGTLALAIVAAAGCSTVSLDRASDAPIERARDASSRDAGNRTSNRRSASARAVRGQSIEVVDEHPDQPDNVAELLSTLDRDGAYPPEPGSDNAFITATEPEAPGDLWQRIRDGFAMPELDTKLVASKEKYYLNRPDYLQRMFDRGSRYLYYIVEEIERRGMPTEIALLPFVESAMNPVALSHAKAAGLWQFIPSTGRAYDLKQDWWVDNRRDVVQSTRAALDYLQMLHDMYDGDWFLALASYNWGEGRVTKAVARNKRAGKPADYLHLRMPRETRNYVPKLIALKNIIANADQLGVELPELLDQPYFVVIEKTRPIDLKLAAGFAGMTVAEFVALNPAHNRPVISASRNNQIKIPAANLEQFLTAIEDHEAAGKAFATWRPYTLRKNENIEQVASRAGLSKAELLKANGLSDKRHLIAGTRILVPDTRGAKDEQIAAFAAPTIVEIVNRPARYHRVRRNDTLGKIARRWGVSTKSLRAWNGLESNTIRRGQRLLVRQPMRQTIETSANGGTRVLSSRRTETLVRTSGKTHVVKRGDTLSGIAQRYNVSIKALRNWNNVPRDRIRVGQRLSVAPARTVASASGAAPASSASTITPAASARTHRVRRGDTLEGIAGRYKVSIDALRAWNGIAGSRILAGQRLKVSEPLANDPRVAITAKGEAIHKVRRGETLSGIAKRYRTSVAELKRWNGLRSSTVMIGQRLKVAPVPAGSRNRKVASSGQSDPAIQRASGVRTVRHRVARGDTLSAIAVRYGVSIADLKRWNSLRGNTIQLGERLDIRLPSTTRDNNRGGKIT